MTDQFVQVTEIAGTEISREQIERMSHRYHWAAQYCRDKDVAEVACGSGQGLGIISSVARNLEAGDISPAILALPAKHYGSRIKLSQFDAQALPFPDGSKDVIILFEALYYVPDARRFVRECARVLRPNGVVLIATANKDLPDFNPSPYSHTYYGAAELQQLFTAQGFEVEIYGYLPVEAVSSRQKILRPVKRLAVNLGLVPKTMAGKKFLKRIVFGTLVPMPAELPLARDVTVAPTRLADGRADTSHKVIYARAMLRG